MVDKAQRGSAGAGRMSGSAVQVLYSDENHAVGHWGNVAIVAWYDLTTLEAVDRLGREVDRLAKEHRGGLGLVTVAAEYCKLPGSDARQALSEFLAGCAGKVQVSALVEEGTGFRAKAVRSMIAVLSTLARQPFPHKVFATIWMAGRWMEAMARDLQGWSLPKGSVAEAVEDFIQKTSPRKS